MYSLSFHSCIEKGSEVYDFVDSVFQAKTVFLNTYSKTIFVFNEEIAMDWH